MAFVIVIESEKHRLRSGRHICTVRLTRQHSGPYPTAIDGGRF
jgi:hypothetical protein